MEFPVFIIVSIFVHVVFFLSIFDIYFTSPLVHGMREYSTDFKPPASRLVLFVADGLRADKFYELDENGKSRSPFMRNIILNHGTWGVSHTRVPTESRPGHVAMIAGFYEDVSAIMKGWKENPVEFDSVFNKSRNTWAFGSPDILPMFAKDKSASRVHIHCYRGDIESFAGDDSSLLDDWVFDEFASFINKAKINTTLKNLLTEDKIVFFLHLLGIDTNGHSHKPMSKEYLSNIKKVDEGVKNVVKKLDDFYGDEATAFVFTSDHGMTDWGSHGAGLPSETFTPLVVWGAGALKHVNSPSLLSEKQKETTRLWGLDPASRHDVNQADIAPMMSSLVGIPIPVNSVGVLPTSFLSMNLESKAKLMFMNAKQINEQFAIKMEMIREKSFSFSPFHKLSLSKSTDAKRNIFDSITRKKYDEAINKSRELINLSLEGLQYFHTYHRTFLYLFVVLGFIGWIVLSVLVVLSRIEFVNSQAYKMKPFKNSSKLFFYLFFIFGVLVTATLLVLELPISYYFYFLLPCFIWHHIVTQRHILQVAMSLISNQSLRMNLTVYCVVGLLGVWSLVFSFFNRFILTLELLIFAALIFRTTISKQTKQHWAVVCVVLSLFPMLPAVGREPDMWLVIAGAMLASFGSFYAKVYILKEQSPSFHFLPVISGFITSTTLYISSEYGRVSFVVHIASWTLLALSWILPLLTSTNATVRMLSIYTCHCASYILISLSYDALFCVIFCILLSIWIKVEYEISKQKFSKDLVEMEFSKSNEMNDYESSFHTLRRSYILLFFLVLAFFGVGNIASINSFDVKIVLPFVTVFNPFIMGGLLAYKVLLPYLLVACTFCCVAMATRTNLNQLCCFALIISDFMGIHFFFLVKDYGSWLDIGTSISHYVISMSMITSLLIFFAAAKQLTTYKLIK